MEARTWKNPIVEEVRKAREEILAECGGNLEKLAERLCAERQGYADRLVTPEDVRRRKADARAKASAKNRSE